MMRVRLSFLAVAAVCLSCVSLAGFGLMSGVAAADGDKPAAGAAEPAQVKITTEKFLAAAYDFCASTENKSAKSCECEQKIIGEDGRVPQDDREMAYYYWEHKKTYKTMYQAKTAADPEFPKTFGQRFSVLSALIMSACGA